MEFPIHERYPPVVQLAIHLKNGQRVYFTEETAISSVSNGPLKTTQNFLHYVRLTVLLEDFCIQMYHSTTVYLEE